MKNVLVLMFLFFIVAACSKSEEGERPDGGLAVSQDTVMVDAGEDILYLKTGLYQSVLSQDRRYLYNFDADRSQVEKIDLEELKLVGATPYEKEGPKGVGQYVYRIFSAPSDEFFILSFDRGGIFDQQGNKKKSVSLKPQDLTGDELKVNENLFSGIIPNSAPNKLYGTFSNFHEEEFYFGVIDMEEKSLKKVTFPEQEYQKDYFFSWVNEKGMPMVMMGPNYFVNHAKDKIFITNNVDNSIHIYNPEDGLVEKKEMDNQLFAHRKTGKYKKTIDSQEEFNKAMTDFKKEIAFSQPVWDEKNERFLRFSYLTESKQDAEGNNKSSSKVWLSAFDTDLNLLGETFLEGLTKIPAHHFVKDGQIWMFENMDDELGFVRFTVE
ncbi:DUF4221 family protein [Litoribacter populi]|uniref:DUF4221 family protein n=1 Tax=Litoribacter populi TaxID=2598460 RepID=UPI00117D1998|nr:DUF4221 family protein [Litoribacter populi]